MGALMMMSSPRAWAALSVAWIGLSALTFRYRREAVRRRLEQALAELAHPDYRRQPW